MTPAITATFEFGSVDAFMAVMARFGAAISKAELSGTTVSPATIEAVASEAVEPPAEAPVTATEPEAFVEAHAPAKRGRGRPRKTEAVVEAPAAAPLETPAPAVQTAPVPSAAPPTAEAADPTADIFGAAAPAAPKLATAPSPAAPKPAPVTGADTVTVRNEILRYVSVKGEAALASFLGKWGFRYTKDIAPDKFGDVIAAVRAEIGEPTKK